MSQRKVSGWVRGSAVFGVLVVGVFGSASVGAARADETALRNDETTTVAAATTEEATATAAETAESTPSTVATATTENVGTTAPAAEPARTLRRLRGSEVNAALVAKAREIVHHHHHEPFGTEIPFSVDGRDYVGRIERHYHPEGGDLKPWGYHPGCSLFAVDTAQ
ncbi:MAG: hypothetical protein JW751_07050 [Polyangiaceae bacterium]|nr:hypothetical protein [Polyangiaceae bacterium]